MKIEEGKTISKLTGEPAQGNVLTSVTELELEEKGKIVDREIQVLEEAIKKCFRVLQEELLERDSTTFLPPSLDT